MNDNVNGFTCPDYTTNVKAKNDFMNPYCSDYYGVFEKPLCDKFWKESDKNRQTRDKLASTHCEDGNLGKLPQCLCFKSTPPPGVDQKNAWLFDNNCYTNSKAYHTKRMESPPVEDCNLYQTIIKNDPSVNIPRTFKYCSDQNKSDTSPNKSSNKIILFILFILFVIVTVLVLKSRYLDENQKISLINNQSV
jgi:hypothetical protein